MYNPAGSDTGREWIEIYNPTLSDVTMVGGTIKGSWRLSDGSNHTLTDPAGGTGRGSLVVPAGGYLVIASDPSEFITGEYSGGSYSVVKSSISLNNAGAALSLIDGNGAVVDSFSYTSGMGGNDDGTSLQRQADGTWLSGQPTPGSLNSSVGTQSSNTQDDSQSTTTEESDTQSTSTQTQAQTQAQTPPEDSYVPPPLPTVFADAGGDETVIVGADVTFDGSAYNRDRTTLDSARFVWNFGDGSTAEGASVIHHFAYPGRYAVVLSVADDLSAVEDQITVTAEPAKLAFSLLPSGGVSIENLAGHDLDLSQWRVVQGGTTFVLPDHSKILSGATIQIDKSTLGFWSNATAELDYPNGTKVLGVGSTTPDGDLPQAQVIGTTAMEPEQKCLAGHAASCQGDRAGTFAPAPVSTSAPSAASSSTSTIEAADLAAAADESKNMPLWLFAAGAVLLATAGVGTVWYSRLLKPACPGQETPSPEEEFEIE